LLIASFLTLVVIAITFWIFTPGTPLASLRLGGLMERVLLIEIEVWYVALGWRLFAQAGSSAQKDERSEQ
jgi:ABC-type cobalamin transport system permease subunit